MTQISGRRTALTFVSALRPGGARFLKIFLYAAGHMRWVTEPLRKFSIIQFARWTVIEQFPGQPPGLPSRPLLLFESNFDDDLADYIDTFAMLVPWRFRAVWFSASGYPGLIPTNGFDRWVAALEATPGHYWSAYNTASTPMVNAAHRVDDALTALATRGASLSDDEFAVAYRRMLIEVQPWI
jgi:hypothetical protein